MVPNLKILTISLAFLGLIFYVSGIFAQTKLIIPTKDHIYQHLTEYTAFLSASEKAYTVTLDKKIQKEYSKIITDKNTDLIKEVGENNFLFDAEIYPYLNSLFNHILDKNSLDKSQFHFFVSRTANVNAYSYEEGTIVCNLGLLNIMENESQITMVLCHELGHYLLKHVNTSITNQLELFHSPEFMAQVKKIKRQEYNSKKQLEYLMQTNIFDRRRHNRSQERAADSLGMVLFRNTAYNGTQVAHVFDLLEASESQNTTGILKTFFTQQNVSIDDDILQPAKRMSFGSVKKEIVDSLKTHPDCASRKITMQAYFDRNAKPGVDFRIGDEQKLLAIKRTALFDEAAYSKEKENLSYHLYQLIEAGTLYPNDKYIKTDLFETLVSLCQHQKEHTLYAVVTNQYIPDDDKDEYAILLKLLDSIDMDKMSEITTKYYTNNKAFITAPAATINNLKQFKN